MDISNLANNFLLAMPGMHDPNFANTLIYLCEHSKNGALGIIITRPLEMTLFNLFEKIEIDHSDSPLKNVPVYFGGPIQIERGFVLHRPLGNWQNTLKITDNIGLTSSRDILNAIGSKMQAQNLLVALGYTGWTQGQLELELMQNAWLPLPADENIIFNVPAMQKRQKALSKMGVDFSQFGNGAGHA